MEANKSELHDVVSPCVKLYKIDKQTELCQGCLRTIDEIVVWSKASNGQKLEIWERIHQRQLLASNEQR
jgi:predicted Fe-S protein YdhL (DUF1289 family)